MKIGIALTGISYNDTVIPGTNWGRKRDYKEAAEVLNRKIIDPLIRDGMDVKVYLYSYHNSKEQEVIDTYNPEKVTWRDYTNSSMASTFLLGLHQLKGEDLDMIFATRFDLKFLNNKIGYRFDHDKFNFLFWEKGWREHNFTTDTFYMFPGHMLDNVILGLDDMIINPYPPKNIGMHNLYNSLKDRIPAAYINVACGDQEYLSHNNSLFTLTREE